MNDTNPFAPQTSHTYRHDARTSRCAEAGETEFAALVRNRSGQDAGEIDYSLKHGFVIDELSDADKQALCDAAEGLVQAVERATGKRRQNAEPVA